MSELRDKWVRLRDSITSRTHVVSSLCIYDHRNPGCVNREGSEYNTSPRLPGCTCANCTTGRDRLAAIIMELIDGTEVETGDDEVRAELEELDERMGKLERHSNEVLAVNADNMDIRLRRLIERVSKLEGA